MSEQLEPGMKVECIDDEPDDDGDPVCVISGQIYTIRAFCNYPHGDGPEPGILLVEVRDHDFHPDGVECCFHPRRFRPIRRRETSIEIFREIVREVKTGAPKEIVDA